MQRGMYRGRNRAIHKTFVRLLNLDTDNDGHVREMN